MSMTLKIAASFQFRRHHNVPDSPTESDGMIFPDSPVASDICATTVYSAVFLTTLRVWEETAKRGIFKQTTNRKLVHISMGLIYMLFWPLFSLEKRAPFLASLVISITTIRMLIVGLGIYKDEATVKSMTRFGDHRELLKGPLWYGLAGTYAGVVYWRSSPIAIAMMCNMCAGDGFADLVGRKFGSRKLPYNRNKSFAGSVAMAIAGFIASVGFMCYFSAFGFVNTSWDMVLGFLVLSLASTLVESLPITTQLDDNLTVPLTSMFLGSFIF